MILRGARDEYGSILIMTLVFMVMFLVIFMALSSLTGRQYREGVLQAHNELGFQVAEAGLNYGRWRLAHDDDDFSDEQRSVSDQFAGEIGTFDVTFTPPANGNTIVTITSVGRTSSTPNREVTLKARYGIPSLARYASITNSDVWYGGTIKGPVHANGGIRMDGTSESIVTSAKETYTCQPHHGCNNVVKPGVWGTGQDQALWQFPVPPVDFSAMTLDLVSIKQAAQAANRYHGNAGGFGWHAVFNANNTYTLYRVTQKTANIWSYASDTGWQFLSHDIAQQVLVGTYGVPSQGAVFFEDTVWVEGTIVNRVTIAAGKLPDNPSSNVDIIINGSITYGGVKDGSRVFSAVAQRHVLIPYSAAANNLVLDGAYVAQKGRFGRRHYDTGSHILKNSLNRYGMIASALVPATTWVNSSGQPVSGYRGGQAEYDSHLLYGPPPYFPTNGQHEFISWEQE